MLVVTWIPSLAPVATCVCLPSGQDVSLGRLAFFLDGRKCACLLVGVGHFTRQPGGSWVVLLFPQVLAFPLEDQDGVGGAQPGFDYYPPLPS